MRRPLVPVIPAQRNPRPPHIAGNIILATPGGGTVSSIPHPRVGTAWHLETTTLTLIGPPPNITQDLSVDVLLNGKVIDTFTLPAGSFVAGSATIMPYPINLTHSYTNPFLVYDTDNLELRQNFNQTPAGSFTVRYDLTLSYA